MDDSSGHGLDPSPLSPAARPGWRRRAKLALLGTIALLYVLSVPWYRDSDAPLRLILGLPDWVSVALACYVGVAVCNAGAWLLADVDDEAPRGEDESERPR